MADVAHDRAHLGRFEHQRLAGFLQVGLVAADQHQLGPGFAQGAGDLHSQAAAAAGDQCPLAIETEFIEDCHGSHYLLLNMPA